MLVRVMTKDQAPRSGVTLATRPPVEVAPARRVPGGWVLIVAALHPLIAVTIALPEKVRVVAPLLVRS